MPAQSLLAVSLPHWQTLAVVFIGVTSAGLTLLLGFLLAGRRRRSALPEPGEEVPAPDPFVFGSLTEKRTSPRRRGNPVKVLLTDADATWEPKEVWVLDRSMGGLCLRVETGAAPAVGTVLSVRAASAPKGVPWTQVEVKSCRQEGNGSWELGCRFLKTPSWSVLLLFG
jgi:hypothetical protein